MIVRPSLLNSGFWILDSLSHHGCIDYLPCGIHGSRQDERGAEARGAIGLEFRGRGSEDRRARRDSHSRDIPARRRTLFSPGRIRGAAEPERGEKPGRGSGGRGLLQSRESARRSKDRNECLAGCADGNPVFPLQGRRLAPALHHACRDEGFDRAPPAFLCEGRPASESGPAQCRPDRGQNPRPSEVHELFTPKKSTKKIHTAWHTAIQKDLSVETAEPAEVPSLGARARQTGLIHPA